jgi:hypothetical protein
MDKKNMSQIGFLNGAKNTVTLASQLPCLALYFGGAK